MGYEINLTDNNSPYSKNGIFIHFEGYVTNQRKIKGFDKQRTMERAQNDRNKERSHQMQRQSKIQMIERWTNRQRK